MPDRLPRSDQTLIDLFARRNHDKIGQSVIQEISNDIRSEREKFYKGKERTKSLKVNQIPKYPYKQQK